MDLNATLLGEVITFIFFVWFTMKFVWPPLMKVMEERRKQIADGLLAARQGQDKLELAEHKSKEILADAKAHASSIIEQAHQRANHIIEASKETARLEGDRLLKLAQNEIQQETIAARQKLLSEVGSIAVMASEKILNRAVKLEGNHDLIEAALGEINE